MNNKKALFIFTEQGSIPASPNKPTGFDLQECAEPYAELSKAGKRARLPKFLLSDGRQVFA